MTDLLIVVDMQRDFVSGALGSEAACAIVPAVAARIRRAKAEGTQVLFTLDTHEETYMSTHEGRLLPVPHCLRGTDGWALEAAIEAERTPNMRMFEKPAFGSVQLAHYVNRYLSALNTMDGKGVTVELCGVCTDICVVSNALLLRAALPEADMVVDSTLCAGTSPERHHAALETMKSCQIEVR